MDDSSNGIAARVNDYLKTSGFDLQPMVPSNTLGVAGPVILFARTPQAKAAADVVHGYLSSIPEKAAPPGSLHGLDAAVVIPSSYSGIPISSPTPTPTPSGGGTGCG